MAGDIYTASGTKFYISSTAVASTTDTLLEYEALTWTEVAEVEDLGNVGDVSNEVTAAALGDGRIRKAKGARNGGTMNLVCLYTAPIDPGQQAMMDAEETNDNYAFKIELPDAPPPSGTPTIKYFRGLVGSQELRVGTNDNVMRWAFNIWVNSPQTVDPAAAGVLMARGAEGGETQRGERQEQKEPAAVAAAR